MLLADAGHRVTGLDFSLAMVERARTKAGAHRERLRFLEADVAEPAGHDSPYDVVLSRHVLWAMPDPFVALDRWVRLLAPGGRLVLVEGRWHTGGGPTADETLALVRATGRTAELRPMPEPVYWGGEIDDERYLVVSTT